MFFAFACVQALLVAAVYGTTKIQGNLDVSGATCVDNMKVDELVSVSYETGVVNATSLHVGEIEGQKLNTNIIRSPTGVVVIQGDFTIVKEGASSHDSTTEEESNSNGNDDQSQVSFL
jgi:hypothetical protein